MFLIISLCIALQEAKCHLSGLGTLSGLESLLWELTGEKRKDDDEDKLYDDDESGSDQDSESLHKSRPVVHTGFGTAIHGFQVILGAWLWQEWAD